MSVNSISSPYPIFTDIDGDPLEAGYIYIGEPDKNPEASPVSVYWDQSLATPAAQPIRTIGGYPSNNGTPGVLYVSGDFSVTVKNKNSSLVYSAQRGTGMLSSINSYATIDQLVGYTTAPENTSVNVLGYHSANDGGGGIFNWDSTADKSTANAGTIIDPSVSLVNQGTGVGLGCWVRQSFDSITPEMLGISTIGDATVGMQKLIDIGNIISKPIVIDEDYECGELYLYSGTELKGKGSLLNASLMAEGAYESEKPLTAIASRGETVINVANSGYAKGDYISIKSVINCMSPDAGDDQLGSIGGLTNYFSEFCEVISSDATSITIAEPLIFSYTLTALPDSGDRTVSTVQKVNFVTDISVSGIKLIKAGQTVTYSHSYSFKLCKDCSIENVRFSADDSKGYFVKFQDCSDCYVNTATSKRDKYPSNTSIYNSFITLGSQNCGFKNLSANGGYQIVDFTFITIASEARPSINCYVEHSYFGKCLDGAVSHAGTYRNKFNNVHAINCDNGFRSRAKGDSIVGFSVIMPSTAQGRGIFIEEGYNEGSIVSSGTIYGGLYGVEVKTNNTNTTPSTTRGRSLVSNITIQNSITGVSFQDSTTTAEDSIMTFENIMIMNTSSRGVYVGTYNNGISFDGLTIINPGAEGINYALNIYGLSFNNVKFSSFQDGIYAIKGPTVSSFITDLATFPDGDSGANLSFSNLDFSGVQVGYEYTGVLRTTLAHFNERMHNFGIERTEGQVIIEQFYLNEDDLLRAQNYTQSDLFTVSYQGKLGGSLPASVKSDITAASDVATLKTAILGLFK